MIKIKWLSPILIEMRSVVMMKGAKMLKFKDRRKDSQTDGRKSEIFILVSSSIYY